MPPAEAPPCQGRRVHENELSKRFRALCEWSHLDVECSCVPAISVKLPVGGAFAPRAYMAAFVTDRSNGFSEREIADLTAVSERLSIAPT
jgi:hypothetical protein